LFSQPGKDTSLFFEFILGEGIPWDLRVGTSAAEMETLLYDSKQNQWLEDSQRYRLTE
jgi:hypothetical protein